MITKTGEASRVQKAARLAVLYELDQADLLSPHSLQEIADALGERNHRSTIMRDLRSLKQVKRAVKLAKRKLDADKLRS